MHTVCQYLLTGRKKKKKEREREGRKEINSATKLLIVNQIISNSLGIIDSAKLFLTNRALVSFGSGLTWPLEERMSTPGGNWSASLGICRWPSNTQCLLSSLRPGGEPGRALTQAPGEAGRGHGLTPSPQIQGPGGAAPRPGVHMALSPPEITAPTASRGGGRGACAQGAKLGWDRRETHSHPGNGLFPRSSLPPNSQNTLHRLQTETAASSETTATAITASGAGPSPVQTRGQERVLAACLPVKPQHEFSFPRTVRSLLAPKVA